ncbi:aminoglycoside phosphotransferase family protein [Thalassotalea atypica]|uniref:aminoglycoside phosphotransferase family protein n=1 Tax=Thalassotalea atypica TaxID=2054316 RepID=UPI002572F964|nr:phosphotransferase [Thalassotalea atypica]
MSQDNRRKALTKWLSAVTDTEQIILESLTGDAGFRQYFRFSTSGGQSVIAVDSPKDKCNNLAFTHIQACLLSQGIKVPQIIDQDEEQGFFCLTDLGNTLLADKLTLDSMAQYYKRAMAIIPKIATVQDSTAYRFPVFDRDFVQLELNIFSQWLLHHHLDIKTIDLEKLQACFDVLIDNALEQPQVVMHRDFHSRNIMLEHDNELAVIDFQDAVKGPITYDVVSLLRDCYVRWPDEKIYPLLEHFIEHHITSTDLACGVSQSTWHRWFDLMGLQRHIKAAGIFARLYLRDNKPGYLSDIPLTLCYIKDVSAHYGELSYLHEVVRDIVIPSLEQKQ